jgi:hypothetical protein
LLLGKDIHKGTAFTCFAKDCFERLKEASLERGAIMEVIKTANVALRFLLELCVLVALGYWGFRTGQGLFAKIGLGIGVPLLAAVVWGLFGAPGSPWQLHDPWHLFLEVVVFGAAAVALFAAGQRTLSIAFVGVFVLNRMLMYIWAQ